MKKKFQLISYIFNLWSEYRLLGRQLKVLSCESKMPFETKLDQNPELDPDPHIMQKPDLEPK
jgi:hypothetical protein